MNNVEQIEYWNGARGEAWAAEQAARDRALGPFGEAALARARPRTGERVVDVGCGCGATALALAEAVGPGGAVLGIDVSTPMLTRARERAAALPHVRFLRADASAHPFEGGAALVFSRFGVMFFDDPGAAFGNLRRALAPGGRLVFACWRALEANGWLSVPWQAARAAVPDLPAPRSDGPGPMSLADEARVRGLLAAAGFSEIAIDAFDHPMPIGDGGGLDAAADEAITLGPTGRLLAGASDADRARARDAVRAALAPHVRDGAVRLPGSAWIVRARAA